MPMTGTDVHDKLAGLHTEYSERRPGSRALHDAARAHLPGGNTRTQVHVDPFPFYVASADGCWIEDVDGFRYRDLVNNYTSLVHGHGRPEITQALVAQARRGLAYGAPSEAEILLARELTTRVPSMEQVRFTNSGTEAVLYAVRTARIITGRDRIVKLEGSYHGGAESVQVTVRSLAASGDAVAEPGVPQALATTVGVVPVADAESMASAVRRAAADAAAVVVEPVLGGTTMVALPRDMLAAIIAGAHEAGALVVFDEVMSFRFGRGGMQGVHGLAPDLTCLGKTIGGGLPVGAFGGRRGLMETWDPRRSATRYAAGTFNANPVTMAAGLAAMQALTPEAIRRINGVGDALRDEVNAHAIGAGVPLVASGYGSVLQFHEGTEAPRSHREAAGRDRELLQCLFFLLLERDVFVTPRGTANVSTALTDNDVEACQQAFRDVVDAIASSLPDVVTSPARP